LQQLLLLLSALLVSSCCFVVCCVLCLLLAIGFSWGDLVISAYFVFVFYVSNAQRPALVARGTCA
jgi:hypothetical protein